MDPDLSRYFRLARFGIAAFVSLGLLIRLWWAGELYGVSAAVFCCWFILAALAQFVAPTVTVWVIGFAAQTLLAIVLVLKKQLTDI